jgi:UPF0176 protein
MHLNAAFYCFAPVENPEALRADLRDGLRPLGVKGTVIVAPEGMNGFLAGPREALRSALAFLRSLPSFEGLHAKESESGEVPFAKLCIKRKAEIVTFRQDAPRAASRRLAPAELRAWLDEGRDFVLLDTRNAYEARLGTFVGARTLEIAQFVDFAAVATRFPAEWKKKAVVTFCTGGIRCEKAAPYLAGLGFENVYQLEDGILGYFEKEGGKHWEGECFVFDQRIALGPDLRPTGARLCALCQGPVPAGREACRHCGAGGAAAEVRERYRAGGAP